MNTSSIVKRSIVFVTTTLALGAAVACSGAAPEGAPDPAGPASAAPNVHPMSLCFAPESGGGSRSLARVTIAKGDEHPAGFAVALSDRSIDVADDGVYPDDIANDGVYAGFTATPLSSTQGSTCVDLSQGTEAVEADPGSGSLKPELFGCDVKTVPCAAGCKSVIFGTKCLVCVEIKC